MKKVEVYETPDGKLYKTKRGYDNHMLKLEMQKQQAKTRLEENRAANDLWREVIRAEGAVGQNATSVAHMMELTKAHYDKYFPQLKMTYVLHRVRFSEHISNSHASPANGVKNWSGKHGSVPTSYPGFYFNLEVRWVEQPVVYSKIGQSIPASPFGANSGISIFHYRTASGRGVDEKGKAGKHFQGYVFMSDLPLVEGDYVELQKRKASHLKNAQDRKETVNRLFLSDKQCVKLVGRRAAVDAKIQELREDRNNIQEEIETILLKTKQDVTERLPFCENTFDALRNKFK